MKPALLYLRKYIEQNYNGDRYEGTDKKNHKESQLNRNYECEIFKEKKKYDWENQNKKEFYFKAPKSFNASKIKNKMFPEERKTHETENAKESLLIEPKNIVKNQKETEEQISTKKSEHNMTENEPNKEKCEEKNVQNNSNSQIEKEVKFIISPPKKIEKTMSEEEKSFEEFSEEKRSLKDENKKMTLFAERIQNEPFSHKRIVEIEKNMLEVPIENENEEEKCDHTRITCKSMKKIGYENLSDYLQEMKNFQKINKKEIKEACYYPLSKKLSSESNQIDTKVIIKRDVQKKIDNFSKIIEVRDNFALNIIEIEPKNASSNGLKRQKSNFSKEDIKKSENFEEKAQEILLHYEKILVCNCENKRFFTYQISKDTDYNEFLKLTTPLLETKPCKENNYLIGKEENPELKGLHFCCLINSKECQKESFFWIGKPIQYYKKDVIINIIDNFLFEVNILSVIESEKIWIVDCRGRNSFISKKMLTRCNEAKPLKIVSLPKKDKSRISKRISLSQQLSGIELNGSLLNLMTNSSNFNDSVLLKKERNNISTKGAFQMVYESKESLR